jgi:hypothetical protein
MIMPLLERRDFEIVRTLGRIRYATTLELGRAFFPTADRARTRLRKLRELDLIRPHRKGIPEQIRYSAWRLTADGIDLLGEAFPEEIIPDALAERLGEGNLMNIQHREAITRLYVRLITANRRLHPQTTAADRRVFITTCRERASQFLWQADGDVTLRHRGENADQLNIPDATLTARSRRVRVFLEMDRSSRALPRIRHAMERYGTYLRVGYPTDFADACEPVVLYVTKSRGRREGIATVAREVLTPLGHRWDVTTEVESTAWLESHLFAQDAPTDMPLPTDLPGLAREMYVWMREYQDGLRANGQDLPDRGRQLLRRVYDHLTVRPEIADAA